MGKRGLKIGVIGAGIMGQNHLRILASLPGAALVGIADPDSEKLKTLAARYDVPVFPDYQRLLPLADALIIASPTATHYQIAVACLNAGKHLLIEKPPAKTCVEARQLIQLADEKKLAAAVGFIERFNPAYQELIKLIRKEKIIGVQIQRFSPFPERVSDVNVIQDMMIHDLDLLLNLFPNETIEEIKAEGRKIKTKVWDKVSATFYYKTGFIVKVSADRTAAEKTRKIIITTDNALIEADLLNKRVFLRELEHPLPSVHHTKQSDQLTAELTDFVKAVKTNSAPSVTIADGARAMALAEEVEKACS
ncbi:Gfo/Idh/MocA family oxidoreductase [Candidatus Saganbacteria bacterium]|nr:Gfo/Idh/MocA family oxidoreductase [Candidatus Saganbacteria bacterium]